MNQAREFFVDNNIKVIDDKYTSARDKNGELFVSLTSGGVKAEEMQAPKLYASEERAWEDYKETLLVWLNGRRQVHMRCWPETVAIQYWSGPGSDDGGSTLYYVYSRLTAY